MKINQEKPPYRPISIIFEDKKEADIFIRIIDIVCDSEDHGRVTIPHWNREQKNMLIKISDAFTNLIGYRE